MNTIITVVVSIVCYFMIYCNGIGAPRYRSDFSFMLKCQDEIDNDIKNRFMIFLNNNGFKALDKLALARIKNENHLMSIDIIALDSKDRQISIVKMPGSSKTYVITLATPPPTTRAESLEKELIDFAEKEFSCHIYNITRGSNDHSSSETYYKIIGIYRKWITEFETSTDK